MQVIAIIGIFNVLYTKAVLICSTLVVYHVELPELLENCEVSQKNKAMNSNYILVKMFRVGMR